ncbi:unnamed protein product [Arabidopsis halleri]
MESSMASDILRGLEASSDWDNTNVDARVKEKGAVLHFNGNLKPWLKIGIEKYKPLWERYVDYSSSPFYATMQFTLLS